MASTIKASGTDMNTQVLTIDNTDTDALAELFAEKPAKIVQFEDDPIALSCASYRLGQAGYGQYHDFDMMKPEPEDRQQALNIRNYYRAKITWQMLKNTNEQRPVSEFRRKLMGIIENNYDITQSDLGILYRIPYFYQEDTEHDAIFADLPQYEIIRTLGKDIEETFVLTRQVSVMRRSRDTMQYWLRAEKTIVPCMIVIDSKNTLKPLLDSVLSRGPVRLEANWYPKKLWGGQGRDREYYQLGSVRLA